MAYHNTLLPSSFTGWGSSIGPRHKTIITQNPDGQEWRRSAWEQPARIYRVQFANAGLSGIRDLHKFVIARGGAENSFPIVDYIDHTTASDHTSAHAFDDVYMACGDGVTKAFQLAKHYGVRDDVTGDPAGQYEVTRTIRKTSDVKVGLSGVLQTETTHYTIDHLTGIVTFVTAPTRGAGVTAGCDFYTEVQFSDGVDKWTRATISGFDAASYGLVLEEVKYGHAADTSRPIYDAGYADPQTTGVTQIEFQNGLFHIISPAASMTVRCPETQGVTDMLHYGHSVGGGGPYFAVFNNSALYTLTLNELAPSGGGLWVALDGTSTIPPGRCRKLWLSNSLAWRMH